MEITLLILENHGIVILNFCGNPEVSKYCALTHMGNTPVKKGHIMTFSSSVFPKHDLIVNKAGIGPVKQI